MPESELMIETPVSLLPDLTELGIEEADNGVCLDTPENRTILRDNKLTWVAIYTSDGAPTDYLQAKSALSDEARLQKKSALLSNIRDVNSDYISGYDLILNDDAMALAPAWVLAATRKWNKIEEEREETGEKKWPHLHGAPNRCVARKSNGARCQNWHNGTDGDGDMCKMHLNRTNQRPQILLKSRNRVQSIALNAVEELEALMRSATSEPVRLKAATEILDRAGIRAGIEIDEKVTVEVRPAAVMISDRLKKLRAVAESKDTSEEDIVDAEEVEEDNER